MAPNACASLPCRRLCSASVAALSPLLLLFVPPLPSPLSTASLLTLMLPCLSSAHPALLPPVLPPPPGARAATSRLSGTVSRRIYHRPATNTPSYRRFLWAALTDHCSLPGAVCCLSIPLAPSPSHIGRPSTLHRQPLTTCLLSSRRALPRRHLLHSRRLLSSPGSSPSHSITVAHSTGPFPHRRVRGDCRSSYLHFFDHSLLSHSPLLPHPSLVLACEMRFLPPLSRPCHTSRNAPSPSLYSLVRAATFSLSLSHTHPGLVPRTAPWLPCPVTLGAVARCFPF